MDKKQMQHIKSRFFALRNGVIADRLRKSGSPYKIIFGLMLPQMEQIAGECVPSKELAEMLWNNRSTRESRLLASMVYPREEFTAKKAEEWISDADTVELVDLLCFRLVRYIPEAEMLAKAYFCRGDASNRYVALRLSMNLLVLRTLSDIDEAYRMAQEELAANRGETIGVCRQIIDEIDWLRESGN